MSLLVVSLDRVVAVLGPDHRASASTGGVDEDRKRGGRSQQARWVIARRGGRRSSRAPA